MKLCRFNSGRFGVAVDGGVVDVTEIVEGALAGARYPFPQHDAFIAALPTCKAAITDAAARAVPLALDGIRFDLPVANPGKIVAAPVNYAKHLEEVRDQPELNHANAAHMRQIHEIGLFLKANSSLIGPSEPVRIGQPDRRNDHEIELVAIIGREGKNIAACDALDYVAGYAVGLDMTVRGPEDRSFRKSLDTYTVLGPWLVTSDELPDPFGLDFELKVNGLVRQRANTRDLVLGVPELIAFASSFYTLHPGDLLFTGTPEGVGPVTPGDRMDAWIDQVGTMSIAVE